MRDDTPDQAPTAHEAPRSLSGQWYVHGAHERDADTGKQAWELPRWVGRAVTCSGNADYEAALGPQGLCLPTTARHPRRDVHTGVLRERLTWTGRAMAPIGPLRVDLAQPGAQPTELSGLLRGTAIDWDAVLYRVVREQRDPTGKFPVSWVTQAGTLRTWAQWLAKWKEASGWNRTSHTVRAHNRIRNRLNADPLRPRAVFTAWRWEVQRLAIDSGFVQFARRLAYVADRRALVKLAKRCTRTGNRVRLRTGARTSELHRYGAHQECKPATCKRHGWHKAVCPTPSRGQYVDETATPWPQGRLITRDNRVAWLLAQVRFVQAMAELLMTRKIRGGRFRITGERRRRRTAASRGTLRGQSFDLSWDHQALQRAA